MSTKIMYFWSYIHVSIQSHFYSLFTSLIAPAFPLLAVNDIPAEAIEELREEKEQKKHYQSY